MSIWNHWAKMHRNARALGAAFMMLIAIVTMQLVRCDPMESRENIPGEVTTVEAEGLGQKKDQSRVVVVTADSVKIRLLLPPPVPIVGNVIPLVAEHYKKRDTLYYLDREKWQMHGPQ